MSNMPVLHSTFYSLAGLKSHPPTDMARKHSHDVIIQSNRIPLPIVHAWSHLEGLVLA